MYEMQILNEFPEEFQGCWRGGCGSVELEISSRSVLWHGHSVTFEDGHIAALELKPSENVATNWGRANIEFLALDKQTNRLVIVNSKMDAALIRCADPK